MKKLVYLFLALMLVASACNEEPPIEPNAEYTLSLPGTTAYAGESFYMYLDDAQGEFLTLFRGLTEGTTYSSDDPTRSGTVLDANTDSVEITYNNAGEYELTLVASSSGNWAEDYVQDVYTQMITVEDSRTGFVSMEVGGREGEITEDNEILFYAHKLEDISRERVKFITASANAVVTVDGEVQENGRNYHDFSAVNPGDNEGRPVVYTVQAPSGETETYTAKFILRDPSPEKTLYSVSSSNIDAEFTVNEQAQEVLVSYYEGTSLSGRVGATASPGATVEINGAEIQESEKSFDLSTVTTVTVIAEDQSTVDYDLVLYEKEKINAFNFTSYDAGEGQMPINPPLMGDVDFEAKTIDMEVLENLDLTNIVTTFEGISDFTLKVEGTTLTSGVTEYDYSLPEDADSETFQVTVWDGVDLIDTYTLTVHY